MQALHQKRSRRDFLNVSIGGLYLAAFSPEGLLCSVPKLFSRNMYLHIAFSFSAQAESSDELGEENSANL